MSDYLPSIDLDLSKKLKDRDYRQSFFLAETSALLAKQLINLRKRRGLNQTDVAKLLKTGQPAISRVESADYRNWSFNTLRRLANAMDARLRILIEPMEDVLNEYEQQSIYVPNPTQLPKTREALSEGVNNAQHNHAPPKPTESSLIFRDQEPASAAMVEVQRRRENGLTFEQYPSQSGLTSIYRSTNLGLENKYEMRASWN